jgi:hypothetical protein
MPDFVVGGPVTDDDFLYREEFVDDLWDDLTKNNILLIAPRRTGKTSVMTELLFNPRNDWLPVYLNVEELKDPGDFCLYLIDALNEYHPRFVKNVLMKTWEFFKTAANSVEIEAYDIKFALKQSDIYTSWKFRANELIDQIKNSDKKILFIIDELPDMLLNMQKTNNSNMPEFIHWFRKIRTDPRYKGIRWLVAGSVNIEGTLSSAGELKTINDLKKAILPPFSLDNVKAFVTTLLGDRNITFDDDLIPAIYELLGSPIPYFLQLLTQELYRYCKHNKISHVSCENLNFVFEKVILGINARDKLQHNKDRIKLNYPEQEREAAYKLLNHLSLSENYENRKTLFNLYKNLEEPKSAKRSDEELKDAFNNLLLKLETDFYIEEKDGHGFYFSNKLLKRWWKKYYGYNR